MITLWLWVFCMYYRTRQRLLLTSAVHFHFKEAYCFCNRALNNDVTKRLGRRCADDGHGCSDSHRAVVLSTNSVRWFEDWRRRRRGIVCQTDHKVVQTICYTTEKNQLNDFVLVVCSNNVFIFHRLRQTTTFSVCTARTPVFRGCYGCCSTKARSFRGQQFREVNFLCAICEMKQVSSKVWRSWKSYYHDHHHQSFNGKVDSSQTYKIRKNRQCSGDDE